MSRPRSPAKGVWTWPTGRRRWRAREGGGEEERAAVERLEEEGGEEEQRLVAGRERAEGEERGGREEAGVERRDVCVPAEGRGRGGRRRRERLQLQLTDPRVAAAGGWSYCTRMRWAERQGVSA